MIEVPSDEYQTNQLVNLNFNYGDPIARYFIKRQFSPVRIALLSYGLAILTSVLIALFANTLLPSENYKSLISDYPYYISELMIPLIWYYYTWIISAPNKVIRGLEENEVISSHQSEFTQIQELIKTQLPVYIGIFLGMGTAIVYYISYSRSAVPLWFNTISIYVLIRSILVLFPTGYIFWNMVTRMLLNINIYRKLLRSVHLHPLFPDNAGGLLPLGQYALRTSYLITIAGFIIVFFEVGVYLEQSFSSAWIAHFGFLIYLILAPIVFFAPLGTAHTAMRSSKKHYLLEISNQFNQDISKTYLEIRGEAGNLRDNIEKIEQLQRLYKLIESFPVWPFDTSTIRKFLISASSPVITLICTIIAESIISYFFPK